MLGGVKHPDMTQSYLYRQKDDYFPTMAHPEAFDLSYTTAPC